LIEQVDIMNLGSGHVNTGWKGAAHVEQGVYFHGTLVPSKLSPGKQGQAQIDSGGVESINGVGQIHGKRFVAVEMAGLLDEEMSEVSINTPVTFTVGMGQGGPSNLGAKTHVVKLGLLGPQAGFNIPQTLSVGELREGHAEELFPAREVLDVAIAVVALDAELKFIFRDEIQEL